MNNYIEVVGLLYPNVECSAKGPFYEDIVWESTVIPKATLAAEIANIAEYRKGLYAEGDLNTPLNKTLRDLLLDIEQRLRGAGQTSTIPSIAAATNTAEYKSAVKAIHEAYQ